MEPSSAAELYSPAEIARAAGVPVEYVLSALHERPGGPRSVRFVRHADALRIGRALVWAPGDGLMLRPLTARPSPLFSIFAGHSQDLRSRPVLAVSSTLHVALVAAIIAIATLNIAPEVAAVRGDEHPPTAMQLVFFATPGPGGGGGGGGLEQPEPPPPAKLEGPKRISSPIAASLPVIHMPPPRRPAPTAERLPSVVVAPIATMPADSRTRVGVAEDTRAEVDSSGPGKGGGVGSGTGAGVGAGDGNGIGPGSGGGFGGGPYRPGSGINPPRLLKEVKADYTEDARRTGLAGEVVLEIVVRSDGTVGDVKILQGLGGGLNERAAQAVRQWRFAPADRQGAPVDVYVEVAVEFKLR